MSYSVRKGVTGICPVTKCKKTISVDFAEYSMCGDQITHYQKVGFDCEDADECTYRDEYSECPIFLSVQDI